MNCLRRLLQQTGADGVTSRKEKITKNNRRRRRDYRAELTAQLGNINLLNEAITSQQRRYKKMKAIWKDVILAESDNTIVVEGNHYFPPDSVKREYLKASDTHTTCPWKGEASYLYCCGQR